MYIVIIQYSLKSVDYSYQTTLELTATLTDLDI